MICLVRTPLLRPVWVRTTVALSRCVVADFTSMGSTPPAAARREMTRRPPGRIPFAARGLPAVLARVRPAVFRNPTLSTPASSAWGSLGPISSFAWWASGRLLALGRYRGLFARSAQRRCRYTKTPSGRVLIAASAHRSPVSRVHAGRGGATLSRVLGLVGWLAVVERSPSGYEWYRSDDRSSAGE